VLHHCDLFLNLHSRCLVDFALQVLSDESVKEMRQMMAAVMDHGTGRNANVPEVLCLGKTGTTQNNKDAWLIAMTPQLVTGVWSGCDQEKPMRYLKGGSSSVVLWKAFNQHALRYFQNPQKALAELEQIELPPLNKNGIFEPLTEEEVKKQGLDQEINPDAQKASQNQNRPNEEEDEDDDSDEDSDEGEESDEEETKKPAPSFHHQQNTHPTLLPTIEKKTTVPLGSQKKPEPTDASQEVDNVLNTLPDDSD
jgi:membrane peptidoglycan carboxypeptidase